MSIFKKASTCCARNLIIITLLSVNFLLTLTAQAATYTYSNSTAGTIPSASSSCTNILTRTFNVTDNVTVGDVNLGLVMQHMRRNDLSVRLVSPSGTEVSLMSLGTFGQNINYLFDDEATTAFDGYLDPGNVLQAPDTGNHNLTSTYQHSARPIIGMGAFDGENAAGVWTLKVCDALNSIYTGSYQRAQLFIESTTDVPPDPAPNVPLSCSSSNLTSGWSVSGASASSGAGALTATITTSANAGASWAGVSAGTMNTINSWSSSAVQGRPSWQSVFYWDNNAERGTEAADYDGSTGQITFSFGREVTNPVIHLDRIGGTAGGSDSFGALTYSNGMRFTPVDPSVQLVDVGSASHLEVTTDYIQRTPYQLMDTGQTAESSLTPTLGTAAGSFGVLGTHSSITFDTKGVGTEGGGADGIEVVMCIPQADVSLTQSVSSQSLEVGDTVTITLTVNNASGGDATNNLQVTDVLPAGLTFVSAVPSQGSYDETSGLWSVGTVNGGANATLTITATASSVGEYLNDAIITNTGVTDIDATDATGLGVDDLGDGIADDDETRQTIYVLGPPPFPEGPGIGGSVCNADPAGNAYADILMRWEHNNAGGTSPSISIDNTGIIQSGTDEAYTGLTAQINMNDLNIDRSSISVAYNANKYISYSFTTQNFSGQIAELYGFAASVYNQGDPADNQSTGAYKVAILVDDDAAFSSPTVLINELAFNDGDNSNADAVAPSQDFGTAIYNVGHYNADNIVTLEPSKTYYVRVYPYADTKSGIDYNQPFSDIVLWDDFMLKGAICNSSADYGDAPADGSTSPNGNGTTAYGEASHTIVSGLYLGAGDPDADAANQPSADAGFSGTSGDDGDGNDDDDGISLPPLTAGSSIYTIPTTDITASGNATLHAWIDFDGNGTFDLDEYKSVPVNGGNASQALSWDLDSSPGAPDLNVAMGDMIFARFRLTSDSSVTASTPASSASDGEVEDYAITITAGAASPDVAFSTCQAADFTGISPDGIEDRSFPRGFWAASYYQGQDGFVSSSYSATNGAGGAGSAKFRGEAFWGTGENPVATSSNGSWNAVGTWSNDGETPTSPNLPHSSYVGATWSDSNAFYQIDFRRTIDIPGVITLADIADSYTDDGVEVYVNGVRQWATHPTGGGPNGWISQSNPGRVSVAANDEVLIRFINLGDIGGYHFAYDVPGVDCSDTPTTGTNYGTASHIEHADSSVYLGSVVDDDTSNIASTNADGDDADDDGVFTDAALSSSLQGFVFKPEESVTLHIPVTGAGLLYAWIDWDGDGTFGNNNNELIANGIAGSDEKLVVNAAVPMAASLGTTYARFRFSSDASLSTPTGLVTDGEVEDYQITVSNSSTAPTAPSIAYCSNTWSLDGSVYKSTTSQGVEITAGATAAAGAAWSFAPNDAFNETGVFSLSTLNGTSSLSTVFSWDTSAEDGRLANATDDAAIGTLTFGFSVPVKNPVIHIDRQGGFGSSTAITPNGLSNSSIITPNAANATATFTRLAGTSHFEVTSNTIQRTPNETMQNIGVTGLSGADSTVYTAMGSVQVDGTYNSLSLDFSGVGVEGSGADGLEFVVCAEPYDYGDAPASYQEATHKIPETPSVYLGSVAPDKESLIQHAANGGSDGLGDDLSGVDDEDAYDTLPSIWTTQSQYRLKVDCSEQGAYVSGWIDFNQNGEFDASERNTDYPTNCNSVGTVILNWTGLSGLSSGTTYARLRIASDQTEVSTSIGTASDGEVEDYPVVMQNPGAAPGVCEGVTSWWNPAGQSADPTSSWSFDWTALGIGSDVTFSSTKTGSTSRWSALASKVFTSSEFVDRFGSPGSGISFGEPATGDNEGFTQIDIAFDDPLPANTYMVVRDIDATGEFITFSNYNQGSLLAPSYWETQSPLNTTANSPSIFASWNSALQQIVTLSDGPNNDQEAYVWPVTGLRTIRATYETAAGFANIGFVSCIPQDHGDAPDTYATYKSSAGPQHGLINGVYLGANTPDTESDGQPSTSAANDGVDEDGISALSVLTTSDRVYSTTVTATNDTGNPATLIAWIDFDRSGTFDADEAAIRTVSAGSSSASYTLNWSNVPVDIQQGDSYLRMRLTTDSLNNREPGGAKLDGEVEDYPITITTAGVIVSGRVFRDINVNAANDYGEVGVTQLPVVLYNTSSGTCVSTRTDGNGDYRFEEVAVGNYQVYEASRERVPNPDPARCGPSFAKDPGGYRSTTVNALAAFDVSNSDITDKDFGDVKPPVFEPNNSSQILPGNVLFYAHRFTTPTQGMVSFTSVSGSNVTAGWASLIYQDSNCNGRLDGTEGSAVMSGTRTGNATTSSWVSDTVGPVTAGSSVCLINKVYAPANVAANDRYQQTITANFNYANAAGVANAIAGSETLTVTDVTTAKQVQVPTLPATPVVEAAPAVEAVPEQPATPNVPATETTPEVPSTPYIPETDPVPAQSPVAATPVVPEVGPSRLELRKTVRNIDQTGSVETETVNAAKPGDRLEYRIYYRNTGTGPLDELIINDTVPPYTELIGVTACGTLVDSMSCVASPVGLDDSLKWTFDGALQGGSGSFVSYQVQVDE